MIQFTDTHSLAQVNAARLGPNHGYRIEGDIALLHADIAVSSAQRSQWALQLWACERPFSGGTLQGVKVAEAALPLADASEPQRLDAEALARVPGGQRDYSMVLVLASGSNGAFDQIHDFANYPARERFITPHLDGSVGYQVDGSEVVLHADGIRNPRTADNLSGSLALELWGVEDTYHGGPIESGSLLATADIGRIAGDSSIVSFEERVRFNTPAAGRWNIVLMLREWASAGYVTRDFCTFGQQYVVSESRVALEPQAAVEPVAVEPTAELKVEAPAPVEAKIEAPVPVEARIEAPKSVEAPKEALRTIEAPKAVEAKFEAPKVAAHVNGTNGSALPQPLANALAKAAEAVKPVAAPVANTNVASAAPVASVKDAAPSAANTNAVSAVKEGVVSIMRSSVEDIAQLKGLTRKIAVEVVKGRPYASLDELTRVRGIGPKLLSKLRSQITL
ncbi:MAG TPA: helix-hairpin-helix domain-containing protein [Polyangiales bacterium]|nr:helix-hairpin-helix domain-containing protein [Polyangiales bacterium]